MPMADPTLDPYAFPTLDQEEMQQLCKFKEHTCEEFQDGQTVFKAGQPNMSMYVVESGGIDILNPADENKKIVSHGPGHFSGDIDLLTGRPIIVNGVAHGRTSVLKVAGGEPFRTLLNRLPRLSEKLIIAMQARRRLLEKSGIAGVRVIGPADCPATNEIREFLYKNFVPSVWVNSDSQEGQAKMCSIKEGAGFPIVEMLTGDVLTHPSLHELAEKAGIWKGCPSETVDLAIVGGGPAGLAAGVYAASEGLCTIVLDCLGPGGQAGASSRIENFIGFPAGLSGAELATRGPAIAEIRRKNDRVRPRRRDRNQRRPRRAANPWAQLRHAHHRPGRARRQRRKMAELRSRGAKKFERMRRLSCLHCRGVGVVQR